MPPLVAPLYYDEYGNPVYAEPVQAPSVAPATAPVGPPSQPAYIPESSATYQYTEPAPEVTPHDVARPPTPGYAFPTLDWLGGLTGRYGPAVPEPTSVESFASNSPPITQDQGPREGPITWQAELASDAQRAALLPSNRSSGIWPTAAPGPPAPGYGYPTLEEVTTSGYWPTGNNAELSATAPQQRQQGPSSLAFFGNSGYYRPPRPMNRQPRPKIYGGGF